MQSHVEVRIQINRLVSKVRSHKLITAFFIILTLLAIIIGIFHTTIFDFIFREASSMLTSPINAGLGTVFAALSFIISSASLYFTIKYNKPYTIQPHGAANSLTMLSTNEPQVTSVNRYDSFQVAQIDPPISLTTGKIRNPEEFFDRQKELVKLIERTKGKVSTAFSGLSPIGKTWLITYFHKFVPKDLLGQDYQIAYIDCCLPSNWTIAGFIENTVTQLNHSNLISIPGHSDLALLESVVRDMSSHNQTAVLCIDEFEHLKEQRGFNTNFFKGLRAIAQDQDMNLVIIVTSKKPLKENRSARESRFHNIFEHCVLNPFSKEEVEEFKKAKGEYTQLTEELWSFLLDCASEIGPDSKLYWPPFRVRLAIHLLLTDKNQGASIDLNDTYKKHFKQQLDTEYHSISQARQKRN